MNPAHMLHDLEATIKQLSAHGKVAIVGYCLGGSLAWFTACRLPGFAATVGYYGGMIAKALNETPKCPVMLHFGEEDGGIPMSDVAAVKATADPAKVRVFSYAGAGHAFNRAGNHAWHGPSAELARGRTLDFLRQNVG
jgi:carboxymethylenebutenolidase